MSNKNKSRVSQPVMTHEMRSESTTVVYPCTGCIKGRGKVMNVIGNRVSGPLFVYLRPIPRDGRWTGQFWDVGLRGDMQDAACVMCGNKVQVRRMVKLVPKAREAVA